MHAIKEIFEDKVTYTIGSDYRGDARTGPSIKCKSW